MLSPRWCKVGRDIANNKLRSLLVVLSMALGLVAVGLMLGTQVLVGRDLAQALVVARPANVSIFLRHSADDELLQVVRRVPGVEAVEGWRQARGRIKVGAQWYDLEIMVRPYDQTLLMNRITPVSGAWPPREGELLLEQSALSYIKAELGQQVMIEVGRGKPRMLQIAGLVHNVQIPSANITRSVTGYVSLETWTNLGLAPYFFSSLRLLLSNPDADYEQIQQIVEQVRAKIEKGGHQVVELAVANPGEHPAGESLQALFLILGGTGFFALLLSGLLIVNTLGAVLTQHVRQIGIMKASGARSRQLTMMYLGMALIYGLLALLIAIPLILVGAELLARFCAALFNLPHTRQAPPWLILVLVAGVGVLVPPLAALLPVVLGTRITVYQALHRVEGAADPFGRSVWDRLLPRVRGLPRPLMLSLGNTFRRKHRLALTLAMLGLAGMLFMTVFTLRSSLLGTLDRSLAYWDYDLEVYFISAPRAALVEREALRLPGVRAVESWGTTYVRRVRPDGSQNQTISIIAPPAETHMLHPALLAGRWLLPADERAVVINTDLLQSEPDLEVGDEMLLTLEGRTSPWRVVGLVQGVLSGPSLYMTYPAYGSLMGDVGRTPTLKVTTHQHDGESQRQVAEALTAHFERLGIRVGLVLPSSALREGFAFQVNIIVAILLMLALLLALVGGMGLMGTMSINVMERTREFGVMRAIGARDATIGQIVLTEGWLTGFLGWGLGALMARWLSQPLSDGLGMVIFQAPLNYHFSLLGVLIWLGVVMLLASLASLWPAWSAARLTVREVLAYE